MRSVYFYSKLLVLIVLPCLANAQDILPGTEGKENTKSLRAAPSKTHTKNSIFQKKEQRIFSHSGSGDETDMFFFQGASGIDFFAIGNSAKFDPTEVNALCYGGYFSARGAYRLGKNASLSLGTNFRAMISSSEGFLISLPLTIGYSFGSDATPNTTIPVGGFINAGYGTTFFIDDTSGSGQITGPTIEGGYRIDSFELRFSLLRQFKSQGNAFVVGMAFGRCF